MNNKPEANYKIDCVVCGSSPTVNIKDMDGEMNKSELCGACFFGEAKMIEPNNWGLYAKQEKGE